MLSFERSNPSCNLGKEPTLSGFLPDPIIIGLKVPDDLRPDLSTGTSLEDLTLSEKLPAYTLPFAEGSGFSIIKSSIDALSNDLRKLSLDLWEHPELAWKEFRSHNTLVEFMKEHGFEVTPHAYGVETAFEAVFEHKSGGRCIGFNSEYDALPQIGQACGHNLIAIGGVGAALACAEALKQTDTAGKVVLLGTPAEEKEGGKIKLIKAGAYKQMHSCQMIHPAQIEGLCVMLAISEIVCEFIGHGAHAAGAPWEGINALDAAVTFYNAISMMRQEMEPSCRMHAIIQMREDTVVNVIPDYAKVSCAVRGLTLEQVEKLKVRLENALDAAALATGCKTKKNWLFTYYDVIHNPTMGQFYTEYLKSQFKIDLPERPGTLGSTDFGNVCYEIPALHPIYAIDTGGEGNGNHTPGFTKAARTKDSHEKTLKATEGIAATAWKVLIDEGFAKEVQDSFEAGKKMVGRKTVV